MSDVAIGSGVFAGASGRSAVIYNEAIVKKFVIAAMFWAIVAFLVGVVIA